MNNNTIARRLLKPLLSAGFAFLYTLSLCAAAQQAQENVELSSAPLQATGSVPPNLMILLDSSLSMNSCPPGGSAGCTPPLADGRSRLETAKEAVSTLLDSIPDKSMRIGYATFDGDFSNRGRGAKVLGNIREMDSVWREDLKELVDGTDGEHYTPLAEAVMDIGRYFAYGYTGDLTLHPSGRFDQDPSTARVGDVFLREPGGAYPPSSDVVQFYCQKNFLILLTDGEPTYDRDVSNHLKNYATPCDPNVGNCRNKTDGWGLNGSAYLPDVAAALHDMDLRPDRRDGNNDPVKNNVTSYFVGFADEALKDNQLLEDAGRLGGGGYIFTENAQELADAFSGAIASISSSIGSQSSVSFNSTSLDIGSVIYSAQFDTTDNSGRLFAREMDPQTGRIASTKWDAAERLAGKNPNSRHIITSINGEGVAFRANRVGDESDPQRQDLESNILPGSDIQWQQRLDYVRGSDIRDGDPGFRRRGTFPGTSRTKLLGDIVHSTPIYVGAPELNWPAGMATGNVNQAPYAGFANEWENRAPMVYVGANDGMLHGFNAETGDEVFAYIPELVLSQRAGEGLHYFTSDNYAHRYYVDLTPAVSDVYRSTGQGNKRDWRTVLVGGLRGGGKGYFALDITDPTLLASAETNAEKIVLWEFDGGTEEGRRNLGFGFSEAQIAKLNNEKWVAIFGNGYNSENGQAGLFIVNIDDANDWRFLPAGPVPAAGEPKNGLSSPRLIDLNGDRVVDRVYAGDLHGNLWVFDLSADNGAWPASWGVNGGKPLFTAGNGAGDREHAITAAPLVARNTAFTGGEDYFPNVLVMFGTGRYLGATDLLTESENGHGKGGAFYAVWDRGDAGLGASDLEPRELETVTVNGSRVRRIADNSDRTIDWAGGDKYGWYMPLDNARGAFSGERVVSAAALRRNTLFFSTIIPNPQACASSGTGWLMSFDFRTGLPEVGLERPVTDFNNDGKIDQDDAGYVGKEFQPPPCDSDCGTEDVHPGMPGQSGFIGDVRCTPGSAGGVLCDDIDVGREDREGRLSWEELSPR